MPALGILSMANLNQQAAAELHLPPISLQCTFRSSRAQDAVDSCCQKRLLRFSMMEALQKSVAQMGLHHAQKNIFQVSLTEKPATAPAELFAAPIRQTPFREWCT